MPEERESPPEMRPGDEAPSQEETAGENVCPRCSGAGSVDGRECETCRGTGMVTEAIGGG